MADSDRDAVRLEDLARNLLTRPTSEWTQLFQEFKASITSVDDSTHTASVDASAEHELPFAFAESSVCLLAITAVHVVAVTVLKSNDRGSLCCCLFLFHLL